MAEQLSQEKIAQIKGLYLAGNSASKTARILGISADTVQKYVHRLGIARPSNRPVGANHHMSKYGLSEEEKEKIRSLADGVRTIPDIAEIVGCKWQRVEKFVRKHSLPTNPKGRALGSKNQAWKGGRTISADGYVYVRAPRKHPYARYKSPSCEHGIILEHRLVMENILDRYLDPKEVVHHIDGNSLNNSPDNLEVHSSNGEHLKEELTGRRPNWSENGIENIRSSSWAKGVKTADRVVDSKIDSYRQSKVSGVLRKQRILHARERLGKDHPCLCGTERFLDDTQNDSQSKTCTE